jgi:hypothetical protein
LFLLFVAISSVLSFRYSLFLFLKCLLVSRLILFRLSPFILLGFYNHCNLARLLFLKVGIWNCNSKIIKQNSHGTFATLKNLTAESRMLPHTNNHKFTWTSPDGNTHSRIDHSLIDMNQHSKVLDVWSFKAPDCDTYRSGSGKSLGETGSQ